MSDPSISVIASAYTPGLTAVTGYVQVDALWSEQRPAMRRWTARQPPRQIPWQPARDPKSKWPVRR